MQIKSTLFSLFIFLTVCTLAQGQTTKDATVPLSAVVGIGPTNITLSWPNPGNANLLVLRRTKGQAGNAWQQLLNVAGSNFTGLTDNGVANGQIYEYVIQRTLAGINAFGYVHVAVNAPVVNSRGKVLIFVDSTTADALGVELVRMKNDMRGDGWWPIPFHTGPSSTVQSIKNQIIASYNADPVNVKAVLLIGSVPIPYSGNSNWDGHPEHAGAWPADAYYADVNGTWTDASINNVTPDRAANDNVPGDGKFDQSFMPSAAELQVGRVDFRRINAPAFGATDAVELVKRYLDKNHNWRSGQYTVQNKALIDDNFGYFGGEAFAANGYRNAYPLVGEANVVEGDFFENSNPETWLMGYGCGGGWYQGASGVGSSSNFATDTVNIVFTNLFGSYHGDWDHESDPFMPAALASRGGILTCAWAGRPHWFSQSLASGESIGYSTWETMNAQFNNGFFGSTGESGAHVALLGDPTIRAHVVKPPSGLTAAITGCTSVALNWTASPDPVFGYHIYRAFSQDGPYTRLTINTVAGTTFTDNTPVTDTMYYQARAVMPVTTPGGGTYLNNSIGPISSLVFVPGGGPTLTATGGALTCASLNVTLNVTSNEPVSTWSWVGPNNFSSSVQNPIVSVTGTYTVTAVSTATGCSSTATAIVVLDATAPTVSAGVSGQLTCANTTATITVAAAGLSSVTITGPGGFFSTDFVSNVTVAGTYTITGVSSSNGCIGTATAQVLQNTIPPTVSAQASNPITCNNPSATITVSQAGLSSVNIVGPNGFSSSSFNAVVTVAGIYTVTGTSSSNGCTSTATVTVAQNMTLPDVSASVSGAITCNDPTVDLIGSSNTAGVTFLWSGPCLNAQVFPPTASCDGVYTLVVTAPNGCTSSATVAVAEDIQPPTFNLPPLPPITCANPSISIVVPPLPGIVLYLNGNILLPGQVISFVPPGPYTLTVQSTSNGCSQDHPIVLMVNTTPPGASAAGGTLTCQTQQIQLMGISPVPGVTYLWDGPGITPANETQQNPAVTIAGTYTVTVTDPQNGCTSTATTEVAQDGSLPTSMASVNGELNCTNQTVQLSSLGSSVGALLWSGPNGFTSTQQTPSTSAPGTYILTVTAQNGCSSQAAVEVTQAPDLVVALDPNGILNCDGTVNICVSVTGGTQPYSILWSNGNTSNCALYSDPVNVINVLVTDAGGCTFQSQTIVINQTPPLSIAGNTTNESAVGANDGAIDLSVTGGTGPFDYVWTNGASTQDLTNLPGGTYTVFVTDANGCATTGTFTVSTTIGTEEAGIFKHLLLSPNPTAGEVFLSLQLNKKASLRLEIRDVAGRLIWENSAVEATELEVPIDLRQAPAGIYTVLIFVEDQVFVRKLAVVR